MFRAGPYARISTNDQLSARFMSAIQIPRSLTERTRSALTAVVRVVSG
jgi:hypothetical protein